MLGGKKRRPISEASGQGYYPWGQGVLVGVKVGVLVGVPVGSGVFVTVGLGVTVHSMSGYMRYARQHNSPLLLPDASFTTIAQPVVADFDDKWCNRSAFTLVSESSTLQKNS